jgi:predicted ribosomally synthesized peptide with nif11-like leader
MPIDEKQITEEMIAKAMQCESPEELKAYAKSEGFNITEEEAKAYFAELEDFELDSDALQKVAGGGVYQTVGTLIKSIPDVIKKS